MKNLLLIPLLLITIMTAGCVTEQSDGVGQEGGYGNPSGHQGHSH